jgi:hypothetical protein
MLSSSVTHDFRRPVAGSSPQIAHLAHAERIVSGVDWRLAARAMIAQHSASNRLPRVKANGNYSTPQTRDSSVPEFMSRFKEMGIKSAMRRPRTAAAEQ